MSGNKVVFTEKHITCGDRSWPVNYPVIDARKIGARIVVIFDRDAGPSWRQFQNLHAFDLEGNLLWKAAHPTSETADCYVAFSDGTSRNSLVVYNFQGFDCHIDLKTGKLIESRFTK